MVGSLRQGCTLNLLLHATQNRWALLISAAIALQTARGWHGTFDPKFGGVVMFCHIRRSRPKQIWGSSQEAKMLRRWSQVVKSSRSSLQFGRARSLTPVGNALTSVCGCHTLETGIARALPNPVILRSAHMCCHFPLVRTTMIQPFTHLLNNASYPVNIASC